MGYIFDDRKVPGGLISDKAVKQARTEVLKDLGVRDKFIYKPPVYRMTDGNIDIDQETSQRIMEKKPSELFHGLYIRNTIRYLLFECIAEFSDIL